jgi:hypothetical protein
MLDDIADQIAAYGAWIIIALLVFGIAATIYQAGQNNPK